MIRRVATAAVLLPLVLASILYLPPFLFLLVIDLFAAIAAYELLTLLAHRQVQRYWLTFFFTLWLPWMWIFYPAWILHFLLLSGFTLMGRSTFQSGQGKTSLLALSGNGLTIVYIGLPMALAASFQKERPWELILVLVVVWAGDTVAFLIGRRWGKHRVTPNISPGKTLEGFIAGLAGANLAALVCGPYWMPQVPTWHLLTIGLTIGLSGALGDLFESKLKRETDSKDSSQLLPGHGGLLDRIDSQLFALPAYYLLLVLIQ